MHVSIVVSRASDSRHSLIHSNMILTIHLLMSYATLTCLPIYTKTRNHGTSALSNFLYKSHYFQGLQDTFHKLAIVLRMYLVLLVIKCSAERSFSKLKPYEMKIASEHS